MRNLRRGKDLQEDPFINVHCITCHDAAFLAHWQACVVSPSRAPAMPCQLVSLGNVSGRCQCSRCHRLTLTLHLLAVASRCACLASARIMASRRSLAGCIACRAWPWRCLIVRCSMSSQAMASACCIVSGARVCVVMLAIYGNVAPIARPQFSPAFRSLLSLVQTIFAPLYVGETLFSTNLFEFAY